VAVKVSLGNPRFGPAALGAASCLRPWPWTEPTEPKGDDGCRTLDPHPVLLAYQVTGKIAAAGYVRAATAENTAPLGTCNPSHTSYIRKRHTLTDINGSLGHSSVSITDQNGSLERMLVFLKVTASCTRHSCWELCFVGLGPIALYEGRYIWEQTLGNWAIRS